MCILSVKGQPSFQKERIDSMFSISRELAKELSAFLHVQGADSSNKYAEQAQRLENWLWSGVVEPKIGTPAPLEVVPRHAYSRPHQPNFRPPEAVQEARATLLKLVAKSYKGQPIPWRDLATTFYAKKRIRPYDMRVLRDDLILLAREGQLGRVHVKKGNRSIVAYRPVAA